MGLASQQAFDCNPFYCQNFYECVLVDFDIAKLSSFSFYLSLVFKSFILRRYVPTVTSTSLKCFDIFPRQYFASHGRLDCDGELLSW